VIYDAPTALTVHQPIDTLVTPYRRSVFFLLLAALCAALASCSSYEEKRIRELMHEKGFGSRAQGDATVENYVAGGDSVVFLIPPIAYQDPAASELARLAAPQTLSIDGRIMIPYAGTVQVLGLTESQLATLVKGLLRGVFPYEIDIQARIVGESKIIYAFGETGRKGPVPLAPLGADMTLLRAVASIGWSPLANLSRVQLIRPDAEHPLVAEVDVYHMIMSGNTRANIRVRENDIIYMPPTFLGMVARILERILQPVNVAVQTMLGLANIRWGYDAATGKTDQFFFRF
jgi:protein involved in polysaccharide export with SLBB domain